MATVEAEPNSPIIHPDEAPIEVEIGDDDTSTIGDTESTTGSYTTSVTSSVFEFVYENGRRYTSRRSANLSEYLIPNDEVEQSRLDLVHHLWGLLLRGDLHKAPLDAKVMEDRAAAGNPFRVLDLGTGTGIWAIDFGDAYPSAEVIGTDLSPIQPDWVPPNVKFEVDNFEEEWVFKHKFDYIHGRNLVGSIKDYPRLFQQIYKNLVPGGIVEFHESHVTGTYSDDDTFKPDSAIAEYNRLLNQTGAMLGQPMDTAPKFKQFIMDAGFVEVEQREQKCALGSWPRNPEQKQIGMVFQEIMQGGKSAEAYGLAAFTRLLGWDIKKAQTFIDKVVDESTNRKIHKIYPVFVVHGKKPLDSE